MSKFKKIFSTLFIIVSLFSYQVARAQETETVEPPAVVEEETPEPVPEPYVPLIINLSVDVPAECEVEDSDNVKHNYIASSPSSYISICALQTALDNGSLENVEFSNQFPSMGLFITTLNNVTADPNSQYWSLYYNDGFADLGISSLLVSEGDEISLKLLDFAGNAVGDSVIIKINSLIPVPAEESPVVTSSGGSSSKKTENSGEVLGVEITPKFDIKKAYEFILSEQKEDGSFDGEIYTDWTAIALASNDTQTYKITPIAKLIKYLSEHKGEDTNLTDYERKAMTLMSLGLSPYNTNGENYIEKIISAFDGKQFGDINEDNDDIFALIVLVNSGYKIEEKMLQDSLSFILSRQRENGSWDESIDMTGAGIQALALFQEDEAVKTSLTKAKEFLKSTQKENGSFGDDVSSTAWAMGGITALGEKPEDWKKETKKVTKTPLDYLATIQDADGGIKDENIQNKIWKTAYVLTALSGKTWNQIMQKFEKVETPKAPEKSKKQITKTTKPKVIDPTPIVPIITTPLPAPLPQDENQEEGWFSRIFQLIFNF